ncbi:MAG: hypothetical protein ACR2NO_02225 [Chloroflexota bacterium]
MAANQGALAFWRKVISRYTDAQFEEVQWNDARWRGPVHFFDNEPRRVTPGHGA